MSTATMILGESGTGKSSSMRGLDPLQILLIQAVAKPLPFKNKWLERSKESPTGSIYKTDSSLAIATAIHSTKKPIVIVDDFQYIMANEFMRRSNEKGFDKFTDIARGAWDILNAAAQSEPWKRVYLLSHTSTDDHGTRCKTIGKLLDDKITIEGMVSIVLRTKIFNGQYVFATKNSGSDTTKTPIGMFDSEHIDNDLMAVDKSICEYYQINQIKE